MDSTTYDPLTPRVVEVGLKMLTVFEGLAQSLPAVRMPSLSASSVLPASLSSFRALFVQCWRTGDHLLDILQGVDSSPSIPLHCWILSSNGAPTRSVGSNL
jgi:hypothetical protein